MKILNFLLASFVLIFLLFGNRLALESRLHVRGRRRQEVSTGRFVSLKAALGSVRLTGKELASVVKDQKWNAHHKVTYLLLKIKVGLDLVSNPSYTLALFQSLFKNSPLVPPPKA